MCGFTSENVCTHTDRNASVQYYCQLNKAINMPDSLFICLSDCAAPQPAMNKYRRVPNHHFAVKLVPLLITPVSDSSGGEKKKV